MRVDPARRMAQMYREAWRLQRDFLYAPNFHGLDLEKAGRKSSSPYLAAVAHRADLNYLFGEMLGEVSVGHLYVAGRRLPPTSVRSRAACSAPTTNAPTAATASPGPHRRELEP
jgi:hypothetical protein